VILKSAAALPSIYKAACTWVHAVETPAGSDGKRLRALPQAGERSAACGSATMLRGVGHQCQNGWSGWTGRQHVCAGE